MLAMTVSEERRAGEAASDDAGHRLAPRPHLRRRDRRGGALLIARQARRLRGSGAEGEPVRRALRYRRPLQGRLADPALGGGRGRQPGLAPLQPLARSLLAALGSPRQERGEVVGRPQAADRRLAHALAPGTLQPTCPGQLLPLSDRLTVLHGIERPGQLPGTICAQSAEREMSTPHPPAGSNKAAPTTAGRSPP